MGTLDDLHMFHAEGTRAAHSMHNMREIQIAPDLLKLSKECGRCPMLDMYSSAWSKFSARKNTQANVTIENVQAMPINSRKEGSHLSSAMFPVFRRLRFKSKRGKKRRA